MNLLLVVPVLEWLITTFSNEGDTVLDNCMGSGSTGVAAVKLNRKFIGIDTDEKYVTISRERIESIPTDVTKWQKERKNQ